MIHQRNLKNPASIPEKRATRKGSPRRRGPGAEGFGNYDTGRGSGAGLQGFGDKGPFVVICTPLNQDEGMSGPIY
jgi:hypothetical protein